MGILRRSSSSRNAKTILVLGLAFLATAAALGHDVGFVGRQLLNKKAGPDGPKGGAPVPPVPAGPIGRSPLISGGTVFDVTKYGAKADGKSDSTPGFMKAWVAACQAAVDQAKLVVPPGTYVIGPVLFQGPCKSAKPIVAQFQGIIKATNDLSLYTESHWIFFSTINGLIVNGGGTFDGQGPGVWKLNDCKKNKNCVPLPTSLKFVKVDNAVVYGINSVDPKFFHYLVSVCKNFTAYNLRITAPAESPNTDGMHISRSAGVSVSNSIIGTGDDCISLGDGITDATFTGITCGPGHGLSVGSLGRYKDETDVVGVRFINCTLVGTDNGCRIKTFANSPVLKATDIVFQDIIMDAVMNPIIIDQNYGSKSASPSRVAISKIQFKNIRGTSAANVAVTLDCSRGVPCQGVKMSGINLTYKGTNPKNTSILATCVNANVQNSGNNNPACH